ncbi:SAM-dependent methyltransferase [Streptomyces sodiiphilus]|uniref:SAM-dependent methyltransferase n=1 Tax=Streptomyces sodiiphilus TaxID=226217 RepID=A0ABP5AFR2_9ACTN
MADDDTSGVPGREPVSKIDTTIPHSARIWNYWLGGTDNYEVDRAAGDQYQALFPGIVDVARSSRQFLARSIGYLVREEGLRQFLDIGTGLPTEDNTHEIAQRAAPECRVVYIDNDPLVLLHAHALLTSTPEGRTEYIEADLRDPENILAVAAGTLDLGRPVGVILSGILGHIEDYGQARSIVARLMAGLVPGSCLSLNEGVNTDPVYARAQEAYNSSGATPYHLRTPQQIEGYFDGLEIVEPGIVSCPQWRSRLAPLGGGPAEVGQYGGVGRKP